MIAVIEALEEKIPDVVVESQVSGSHLKLKIVAPMFATYSRIERQRFVKQILAPFIESGELHAVSLEVGDK